MNSRNKKTAERFGTLPRLVALESDLLKIPGVVRDEFDDGCYLGVDNFDEIPQVCACIRFSFPPFTAPAVNPDAPVRDRLESFLSACHSDTQRRQNCIDEIIRTAERHGLTRSGDRIEDYGAHWYIVFNAFGWK